MEYLSTSYTQFIEERLDEGLGNNNIKINCLNDKIRILTKRLYSEKDYKKRRKLQLQIKVYSLKIEIARIV